MLVPVTPLPGVSCFQSHTTSRGNDCRGRSPRSRIAIFPLVFAERIVQMAALADTRRYLTIPMSQMIFRPSGIESLRWQLDRATMGMVEPGNRNGRAGATHKTR